MPGREVLPSTLRRSPKKAQRTWEKTHDSAVETYGEGERAHRTAFAAVKHEFEKVGDHWEPKGRKGPERPPGGRRRAGAPGTHGRRGGRQRHQGPPDEGGPQAGRARPFQHDQARTGQGHREGQRPRTPKARGD